MMNKSVAELWVVALRSGEYTQGKGCLEGREGMCCLGVLCAVADRNNVDVSMQEGTGYISGSTLASQQPTKAWSGIKGDMGQYLDGNLANLNDNEYSFEFLANLIEKNWEDL